MKYDIEYYENMLRNYSETAATVSKIRWQWVSAANPQTVLDYGSGVGWFRAFRPKGVEVFSFDFGKYPQTGIPLCMFDLTCFWDVLEHIPDFKEIEPVLSLSKAIATSLPILKRSMDLAKWKHFKPGEHLHYFTHQTLTAFFERYGFTLVKFGKPECPPREDISSYLFRRKEI